MKTRTKNGYWALAILMALPGCVPSLNPVYRDEDLVFDPAFIGVWTQSKSENKWEFSRRDDKSYRLVYTDKGGQQGRFIARLAELQGTRFLDLFPEPTEADTSAFYKFHLVPIHTIYLVRGTGRRLDLAAIDYKWLDQFLTEHPNAIEYATFSGRKLITAPTQDVQAFVLGHKDSFTANFDLERQKAAVN
jgi:hypothetical protein